MRTQAFQQLEMTLHDDESQQRYKQYESYRDCIAHHANKDFVIGGIFSATQNLAHSSWSFGDEEIPRK